MVHSLRLFSCLAAIAVPFVVWATLPNVRDAILPTTGDSLAAAGLVAPQPVAEPQRTEYDFGRVPAGALLMAGFRVHNEGGRRLVLREKSRSCECVAVPQPEVIVPPGGHTELAPALHTESLSGPQRIEVRYQTNDPNLPTITLWLLADVQPSRSPPAEAAPLEPIPMDVQSLGP